MKFQAEHGSKLEELHRTQVFSQQIHGIIITIDEVDFCQAAVNDLANVVILILMCFDRFSVTGLEAIKIEPWLSPQIGMADRW